MKELEAIFRPKYRLGDLLEYGKTGRCGRIILIEVDGHWNKDGYRCQISYRMDYGNNCTENCDEKDIKRVIESSNK